MEKEDKFGTLKAILTLAALIFCIPYWLCKTVFNKDLDFGTRLSFALLSLPSALLLFEIVAVCVVGAVVFIPVALASDAWPVGVYAIIFLVCCGYQLIKVIASRKKKR